MRWANDRGFCVVTSELDFSAILTSTRAQGPSVIQIRAQEVSPGTLGPSPITVLREYTHALSEGAIRTIHLRVARIRRLPLREVS